MNAPVVDVPRDRAKAPVLVLGLGNDILTDDAVGLRVVESLHATLAGEGAIELRTTTEMGLALLDEVAGRESLVLVDAVQTGRVPAGSILELDASDLGGPLATGPHFLGVGETLALGELLGLEMPRRVGIVAVEVADPYTLGTELTPAVQAALGPAAERVAAIATGWAR
jgi:hydrogenase maturation protease